jgi:hypothetical protein
MNSWMARAVSVVVVAVTVAACSGPRPVAGGSDSTAPRGDGERGVPALDPAGWTDTVYQTLTAMISDSAGQGKKAVFDFDNTTQARDVGEAVLARVQETAAIDPATLSPAMYPPFAAADGAQMEITRGVYDYYEGVLDSGGDADPFREYSSLPMPATVFTGRTVGDFVAQTRAVYDGGSGATDLDSGRFSTVLGAGRPFIYPQMADLYGNLRSHGYDVWIVSAGIGWAVRWMVQNALNPAIVAKYGKQAALPLDHVVAVTTLMKERSTGRLVSDYQLTHQTPDAAYINLDPARLSDLEVLALPDGLTSWRSNRLVISRMNKPDLAAAFAEEIGKAPEATWMLQPTVNTAPVGFLPTKCAMATRTASDPEVAAKADKSLAVLDGTGRLGSFSAC